MSSGIDRLNTFWDFVISGLVTSHWVHGRIVNIIDDCEIHRPLLTSKRFYRLRNMFVTGKNGRQKNGSEYPVNKRPWTCLEVRFVCFATLWQADYCMLLARRPRILSQVDGPLIKRVRSCWSCQTWIQNVGS